MSRYHRENPDLPIQHDAFEGVHVKHVGGWTAKWYVPREPDPTRFTAIKRETARKGLQYGPQSTPLPLSWDGLCSSWVDEGQWIEVTEDEALERIKQGNPPA